MAFIVVAGAAGLSSGFGPNANWASPAISTNSASQPVPKQAANAPVARPHATPTEAPTLADRPSGGTVRARVLRVIDGATILVASGGVTYEVRYLGVEAPASMKGRALAANEALVAGKAVILEAGVVDRDASGRLLRSVWLHRGTTWTLVNLELVRRGLARPVAHPRDKTYQDRYAAAEREARSLHVGLWGPRQQSKVPPRTTPGPPRR